MPETTLEQAKECPKCGRVGEQIGQRPEPNGKGKLLTIVCRTELCKWFDTPWYVTVRADGSIPPPKNHTGTPKVYEGFEGHDAMAEALINAVKHNPDTLGGQELGRRR